MKNLSLLVYLTIFLAILSCNKNVPNQLKDEEEIAALTSPITVIADWETNNSGQWRGIIGRDTNAQFLIGTSAVLPVRQGTYAAGFIVRPNDTIANISGERCEADMSLEGKNNYTLETIGDEYYYGWSTYFPTTWTNPKNFGIFMQFHHNNVVNPPIAFNVQNDTIGVSMLTGHLDSSRGTRHFFKYRAYHRIIHTLNKGLWNDFIVHVKFRPDWTGIVEVWHRVQGQAEFSNVLSINTIPTMQWFDNADLIYGTPIIYGGTWYTSKIWLRNGLYRDEGGSNTNVLFHDNFCRADTYEKIRARF